MPDLLPKTMQDRGAFWTPVPDWPSAVLEGEGWTARPVLGLHRILVSGDLETAVATLAPDAPSIGLWQIAEGEVHALRIGRDRMLITSTVPLAVEPGWNTGGFAVSPADDAYATLEIKGPKLGELLAEMTFVDLDGGSRSAATLVCGQQALLHRTSTDCARIHIEAPLATYLWHWLERR
jgi:sarcosine oxidase gamma subunit